MGGNRFRRLHRVTARIGLSTAQILLGLLLSVGFSCPLVTPGRGRLAGRIQG